MKYIGKNLREINFPLGGIGSGSIGLCGNGILSDWEIFNRPSKGSENGYSQISVRTADEKGNVIAKALIGDYDKDFMGQYSKNMWTGYGFGPRNTSMAGFSHFETCEFDGTFPIANIRYVSSDFPGEVTLRAFNPLIPLDEKNSSIPAAFFEILYTNTSEQEMEFSTAFSLQNPFENAINSDITDDRLHGVKLVNNGVSKEDKEYGDLTLYCSAEECYVQPYWYRGKWQDKIVTFWNEFSSGSYIKHRVYEEAGNKETCAIQGVVKVAPGETKSIRYVLSWNVPNCYNYWYPLKNDTGSDVTWKNYYATVFEDSSASGKYSIENWDNLYTRTKQFTDALFDSTLDICVIDAVSATLSVLKTPTVLRLEDGSFYGWEGCMETVGSCEGTCQHVWNYAYALCFLFPNLEKSIRNYEFKYQLLEDGYMVFRTALPLGRKDYDIFHPCVDGQMGTVIKTYREWKISGDSEWLCSVWDKVKRCLEFSWSEANLYEWDRNKDGVLEGRQHHTLDMELFGPSSWLEGFYLAALKAAAEMAVAIGETEKSEEYFNLFQRGYEWTKKNLFNGKYFIQKIDLTDKAIPEHFNCCEDYWNDECREIKYQIGEGSAIDQLCAQWHCYINGLGYVFDREQVRTALKNMMKNNFKSSMRNFTNPWRIFALNDESGSVICDYPEGCNKPQIPISYCEESMHGFEYQFAGLLAAEGMIDEAIRVVKSVRDRYDGSKRNPWNEIECGNNYARSMASFALIPIFSGFIFDMPKGRIGFNPRINADKFKCFWGLGTGWGTVAIHTNHVHIRVMEGYLDISEIELPFITGFSQLLIDGKAVSVKQSKGVITFERHRVSREIEVI